MKQYTITRDGERDLVFTGEIIASASSSANNASSSFSGSVGRWTELTLYKTKGGKYICESIGRTQHQGEHTRHKGAVCETSECVCEFFGDSWLAKELYADTDEIDCTLQID
jgi:hypothetical protein